MSKSVPTTEGVLSVLHAQGSVHVTLEALEAHAKIGEDYVVDGVAYPCLVFPNAVQWFFDKDRRPPGPNGPMKAKAPRGKRGLLGDLEAAQLVLFEGERDYLSARSIGIPGAICCGGSQNLTKTQRKAITDNGDAVFLFDGDQPGRAAAQKLGRELAMAGCTVHVARLPDGTDFDDWIGVFEPGVVDPLAQTLALIRAAEKLTATEAREAAAEDAGPEERDEFIAKNGDPVALVWVPTDPQMPHKEDKNAQMRFAHLDRAATAKSGFQVVHIVDEFDDRVPASAPTTEASIYDAPQPPHLQDTPAMVRPVYSETYWRRIAVLPGGIDEYGTSEDLFDDLVRFIDRFFVVDPAFINAMAAYVLMTWRFMDAQLESIPYIRVLGPAGSGKTRFARIMRELCARTVFVTGMRPVHLYRILRDMGSNCTMIFEEFNINDKTEDAREFVNMLNAGNQQGAYVPRMAGRQFERVEYFSVFCPKVLGMTTEFSNEGLIRRCITTRLGQMDIPEAKRFDGGLPVDFYLGAAALRKRLLSWRFSKFGMGHPELSAEVRREAPDMSVWQNWYPVVGMVPAKRPETAMAILKLSKQHGAMLKQSRETGADAQILESVLAVTSVEERAWIDLVIADLNSGDPNARWTRSRAHTTLRTLRVELKRSKRNGQNAWYVETDDHFAKIAGELQIGIEAVAAQKGRATTRSAVL